MKKQFIDFWTKLINIPVTDPDQIRRGRLLNILLVGLFFIFLSALIFTLIDNIGSPLSGGDALTYISTTTMLIGTCIIFYINRKWSSSFAAVLFLTLITITIFFADPPYETIWGRNMISLVIPIIMASVIWHRASSFIIAGVIGSVSIWIAYAEHFSINFIGVFAYLSIAMISWLSAYALENALEEARSYLHQLKETQAQLIRQEKLAALGKISGSIAHELRNPLGAIKNAAFVLNKEKKNGNLTDRAISSEDLAEVIEIINREVITSERIITNLLDFTRPKLPVRTRADLNEIIQQSLQRVWIPPNISVDLQLDPKLPILQADPDQLIQVFINLITNGVQAISGVGQITLQTQISKGEVMTSITDTGAGICEENMKNLFEPLFSTKAKGMGLGLFISQKILETHNGRIEFKSQVGHGTTAFVVLPLRGTPYFGTN